MPYNYQLLKVIEGDAEFIWNLELDIRRRFKNTYSYIPSIYFKGQGECLSTICESEVMNYLETL